MTTEPFMLDLIRREQIKPPEFTFSDGRRPRKRCNECGGIFDVEAGFGIHHRVGDIYISRDICIGCQQDDRDRAKAADRWLEKARRTLRSHTRKFNSVRGTKLTPAAFSERFSWTIRRIAHDMEHAFENTCAYCWTPYSEMTNGHWDVTIDIYDRGADPFYSNTRICCQTCNREKGKMTPDQWARRLQYWREKKAHDAKYPRQKQTAFPLIIIDERPA